MALISGHSVSMPTIRDSALDGGQGAGRPMPLSGRLTIGWWAGYPVITNMVSQYRITRDPDRNIVAGAGKLAAPGFGNVQINSIS
jgi:hypothetical protein